MIHENAVRPADTFLTKAKRIETVDLKALALHGLAVCEPDKAYAEQAKKVFDEARTITDAKGQLDDVLNKFDLIDSPEKGRFRETAQCRRWP